MKIGITCYPVYGGSGIVATELGMELAARGHDVHFIAYANPIRLRREVGPVAERLHYHEVEVASYPLFQYPPYTLALASRMSEVASGYGLDLLHVHYAVPHAVAAFLAQQMCARRLPYISTLHGTDITLVGSDRSYWPITRFAIERSNAVTAVSQFLRAETEAVFSTSRPIRVIPNFVNPRAYHPRPSAAAVNAPPRLLHLSNFRPVKRALDCVRILAIVRHQLPAELLMAGDGPERGACERLAIELGIADAVHFLGKQDQVERLLPQADVLLLPSETESFGLAALEAMACGVPVVASRTGGLGELITDGSDGFLEPVGDVAAHAGRVLQLLADPTQRRAMAHAARRTAVKRFDAARIVPLYEQLYAETCEAMAE